MFIEKTKAKFLKACETFHTWQVEIEIKNRSAIFQRSDKSNLPIDDCRKQQVELFLSVLNSFTLDNQGINQGIKKGISDNLVFRQKRYPIKSDVFFIENCTAKLC